MNKSSAALRSVTLMMYLANTLIVLAHFSLNLMTYISTSRNCSFEEDTELRADPSRQTPFQVFVTTNKTHLQAEHYLTYFSIYTQ